jgi:NTE family protein
LALEEACGWDPRRAALVIGTSAGARVGAALRAGLSAAELLERALADHPRAAPSSPSPAAWPASGRYLREVLRRPWRARPARLVAALLPAAGGEAPHPDSALAASFDGRWPSEPLWVTAVHLDTGARVVFGREGHGAPVVDVGTALRCSSAVPGLRPPVQVAGRRYIDGGIASPTHLDLAAVGGPRLAIVASPLSCFLPLRWLLSLELRRLGRRGVRALVFQPVPEVIAAMGWNPMDRSAAPRVAELAYVTTLARLRAPAAAATRAMLAKL